jgi:hypothetical protein
VKTACKVDKVSNFVTQLTEQYLGSYGKSHPVCARWDKMDLKKERTSHEMKQAWICTFITETYNGTQTQIMSINVT